MRLPGDCRWIGPSLGAPPIEGSDSESLATSLAPRALRCAMTLWFVTPAWRRFDLSGVCLEQRRHVIDQLRHQGIEAQCVVVADDENLEIARSLGFETVERDNRWLGRKFNDGIAHALRNGADWVVPIGSDDWIDPAYLFPLPETSARTSHLYAAVEHDRMLLTSVIHPPWAAGPRVLHRSALRSSRPAIEHARRGIDTSMLRPLGLAYEYRDLHPLQYVGFRGETHITLYKKLQARLGGDEVMDPWSSLQRIYPIDLVSRARASLAEVRRPLSVGKLDRWSIRDYLLSAFDRFRR